MSVFEKFSRIEEFRNLRSKYQLFIVLTMLILLLFIVVILSCIKVVEPRLTDAFKSEKEGMVRLISEMLHTEIVGNSNKQELFEFKQFLKNIENDYGIIMIYIVDDANIIEQNFVYKGISKNSPEKLKTYKPDIRYNYFDDELNIYSVTENIRAGSNDISVTVIFSTEVLKSRMSEIKVYLLLVNVLLAVIGMVIAMLFLRYSTKPLTTLLSAAERIEIGDVATKVNLNSNDEFGRVAHALNVMMDSIEEYNFELAQINEDTERNIAGRTQQLSQEVNDRKGIEEKLQHSNQIVRSIINASPYPIVTINKNFEIISASPAILSMFDYEENELVDTEIPIIFPSNKIKFKEILTNQEIGTSQKFVLKGRKKNGTLLDLSIASAVMFDDAKNRTGYLIITDDISEQLKAEAALKESEIKYRSLIEESIVGIGIANDNYFTYANAALLNIFECTSIGEFLNAPFDELVHHEDRYIIHSMFDKLTQNQNIDKTEIRVLCFNGEEKYAEIAPNIVLFENESFLQITFLDISDRKKSMQKIEQINDELEERVIMRTTQLNKTLVELRNEMHQKTKLSSELQEKSETLDKTASFCFVFNVKGECAFITPYTEQAFELPLTELLGDGIWTIDRLGVEIDVESGIMYGKESVVELLKGNIRLDAEPLVLKILSSNNKTSYIQLKYSLGMSNTLILSGTDVTDQIISKHKLVVLADQLSKSLEKEKELNDLKTRFVSMISHEYRTPLTVIMSSTGVVQQAIENQKPAIATKFLSKIENSVKTMTQLMEDVLVFGKAEANKVEELIPVDIVEFVQSIIEDISMAYTYDCKVNFAVKNEIGIFYTSEKMLQHIVQNLITNAMKYTTNQQDADVTLELDDSNIVLRVRDHGIGIPEDDLKHLFTNFHRAKNVGNIAGTGLGLSIVKKNVENLCGTIDVESEVNEGTTFTITLPIDARNLVNTPREEVAS